METSKSEPEGEPQPDIYAQIEVRDHQLPEGFLTKAQMFAQILGHTSVEGVQLTEWS